MAFTMGYNTPSYQPSFQPTYGEMSLYCTSSMTPYGQDFHCYVAPATEAFSEQFGLSAPELMLDPDTDLEAYLDGCSQASPVSCSDGSASGSDPDTESESDLSAGYNPYASMPYTCPRGNQPVPMDIGLLPTSHHTTAAATNVVPPFLANMRLVEPVKPLASAIPVAAPAPARPTTTTTTTTPSRQKAAARNSNTSASSKAKKTITSVNTSVKPVVPKAKPVRAGKASETVTRPRTGKASARRGRGGEHKRRRDLHNDSERVRRSALRQSLENLRLLIPAVKDNPKIHTSQLLRHAVAFIRELEAEDARLSRPRV